jgi:serine/threonine protein kinase
VESLDTLVVPPAEELVLGRYRLRERLGAGGFGVVWSAYDEQLHREVAVKRIWMHSADERAAREAQATARLSHPAIVALYEAQAESDAFYLISELVHGDTLGALLADGELCDEEVLRIGAALAAALEHAHAHGVIHRDVKPHNILVPHEPAEHALGVAKLTDFGGALLVGEDGLTRTGDVLGTLAYMAPEQSEGREATPETDLYSLALVLYEALCGVNPVRGANPADTARRIGDEVPSLERYRRDLPTDLIDALDIDLAPVPRDRGTLAALRKSLEEAVEGETTEPTRRRIAARPAIAPRPVRAPPALPYHAPQPERRGAVPQSNSSPSALPHLHERRGAVPHQSPERRGAVPPQSSERRGAVPHQSSDPPRSMSVPRAVWLLATTALVVWQSAAGRPGVALLVLAAAAPLLILSRTSPLALSAALAPALGTVGLAGVYPAVAGQASAWRARVVLGALGYWWLCLAEPLLARRLWLGPPTGLRATAAVANAGVATAAAAIPAWEGSLDGAFNHALVPLLSTGVLLGAALWAAAALLLPWLVRGRHAALDLVAATVWTAALLAAEPLLDHGLPLTQGRPLPRDALLAAILGGALAVAARALRGPVAPV